MTEEQSIRREEEIHGERWRTLHDGYFSDPEVASSFLDMIENVINLSHPTVIADLGGGTGFILGELLKRLNLPRVRLVNIDVSPSQLSTCNHGQIDLIQVSVSQVTRHQLKVEDGELLLIARSLLHYFDQSGLRRLLRHIRHQLIEGEFFIHQSACFQHSEDADCLNLIYDLMGTDKWYGTIGKMEEMLREERWEICSISSAPKLHLSSQDLSERYRLSSNQVELMQIEVERQYAQKPDVFIQTMRVLMLGYTIAYSSARQYDISHINLKFTLTLALCLLYFADSTI
jgi:SAM-dependent methyltransferase